MAVNTIDAKMLAKMFLAGAKNLESKKEWINELNVFPVPDGDTGTNMTLTIMSAAKDVAAMNANNDLDMKSLAKAISSGSLRGARGNSGVILSQLFRGFTKAIRDYDTIDIPLLAEACEKAVETAYKAVMKPKEGTILTVAKSASLKARELADAGETDLEKYIGDIIERADYVLSQTPELLSLLPSSRSLFLKTLHKRPLIPASGPVRRNPQHRPVLKQAASPESGSAHNLRAQ